MTASRRPTLRSCNPATGELLAELPVTPVEQIPEIVARARVAQASWQELGFDGRRRLLAKAGELLVARADSLGELLCKEMGKPLAEAVGEARSCGSDMARDLDEIEKALEPEHIDKDGYRSTVYRNPHGVCAAITPWNFPISMPHWLALPALATGNTVVLKPSEETPVIAQAYVDVLSEVLPANVLQIVHGDDEQGKALVAAEVDLVAFTGSREVGKKILASAAHRLTRVILELGGKDPMVVLEGADLARAARFAARNSFRNAGQVCVSTERIYVPKHLADELVELLITETEKMPVGSGMEPSTQIGPMINAKQRDHVLGQIDEALSRGAVLAYGGKGHHDLFVMPTVLRKVTHDMAIARQETFGPVACIFEVSGTEEAIALANDTPFGLGASVWGKDDASTLAVARRIRAGMVGVNKSCGGVAGTPWVGIKESGYGFHSSVEGHRQFTQPQVITRKL